MGPQSLRARAWLQVEQQFISPGLGQGGPTNKQYQQFEAQACLQAEWGLGLLALAESQQTQGVLPQWANLPPKVKGDKVETQACPLHCVPDEGHNNGSMDPGCNTHSS